MLALSLGDRSFLSEKILETRRQVAEAVTEEFFSRHPDWQAKYGERGRRHGIEDAVYHQQYLACAIESGSVAPFVDYARWTIKVLSARGIPAHFVGENLAQVGSALQPLLTAGENELVASYIGAACDACGEAPALIRHEQPDDAQTGMALAREVYLRAAIKGERRAAANIAFDALKSVADVVDLYVDLFQAAQYEVGRLWQENQITVAEEHMATAITQYVMTQVYSRLEERGSDRGRVVITGIEGELHQVGANMVADVIEARGWNVRFLGTNLPQEGVLKAIEEHRADVVGISATTLLSVPKAVRLVAALRARFPTACPRIMLGGRAFSLTPELAQELRAEGPAMDLRSALELM